MSRSSQPPEATEKPRRRSTVIKSTNFINKHAKRHHAFDREKAPYPASYDRDAIDIDLVNHVFLKQAKGSVTFVDYPDAGPPERALDLGCGTGVWVLDAARAWTDCTFVGFDLVNIQPSYSVIDSDMSSRIEWVHGNFLTTKLPFDDDEFDHVYIRCIARAVPENKWDYLFEEIFRVLRPGGVVEMIEEDIRFPTVPRWYSAALREKAQNPTDASIYLPNGQAPSVSSPTPSSTEHSTVTHDHALLEALYYSVFESRFINPEPTSVLPNYFSTYFTQVLRTPVINFPVPPIPAIPTFSLASSGRMYSGRESTPTQPHNFREQSLFSITDPSDSSSEDDTVQEHRETVQTVTPGVESRRSSQTILPVQPYFSPPSDDTFVWSSQETALLPAASLSCADQGLALHLHRAYQNVLACQESMWEELKDWALTRKPQLKALGWEDEDPELPSRRRFEQLVERYRSDLHARTALWHSVASTLSWKIPEREPMSKAEILEEERLYHAMLQGRKQNSEASPPCRTLRIFIGFKASV